MDSPDRHDAVSTNPLWYDARDQLVPSIGERAFELVALTLAEAVGNIAAATSLRESLEAEGTDTSRPHLTEAESLLIEWARSASEASGPAPFDERMQRTFSPSLRDGLLALAAARA